ncbi:Protein of unknown function DUF192 (plasmid) [Trichormus variabilis ATCC 29413]|uniref:DUF192 domain-containing protein n=2 Tax=Anabaena variabilis TaxID=264691 RepID=Q3M2N7_TRIV2|nr:MULTISPECIES: DUF192 domain-containing protein [Nostocaceae]ABA24749.1 Protein of unknown function DUF192 [Trichormus variabilis ATCC 29413]MBC1217867.1 DUF192 domain-containing protein [Trichormus variabilis ARAD]MBC1259172.1 DUF192 domain-containing protein [Trichormus variabilis V5]MBC1270743.1 DUF192 domain-containing protein [Trichormus variabilis FSR]MBC1305671.1 DUF192 domain-containing protein [Trichormus variabilis N2B]
MKTLKFPQQENLYITAFNLLNILGPLAGVSIIIGTAAMIYAETRPQNLPLTHILTHNNQTFKLEVASTPEQLEKGLKFRSFLPRDRGMLFNLGSEIYNVPFWMYKVNFPLDIFYLKDNVVSTAVYNAKPCHKTPCPIYKGRVANQVLELAPGAADIKVGDKLKIQPLSVSAKNDIGFDSKQQLVIK